MKNKLGHIGVVILFAILSAIFFSPAVFDGKQMIQGDSEKAIGVNKEVGDYQKATGEGVTWTGALFSGMPTYMNSNPKGRPDYLFEVGQKVVYFLGVSDAGIIFASLLGMYLLMLTMGCNIGVSAFGAIAYAFSSYFIIILPAGHIWKAWAMSWVPYVLMGMMLLFQRKWLLGFVTFAASLSLELSSNHVQITYYLAFLCLFIFIGFVVNCIRKKETKLVLMTTGIMLASAGIAVLTNAQRLYSSYEMSKVSIRAPSRLSSEVDGKEDKSTGLDQNYAFAWSYGCDEMLTLLVPNVMGGESGGVLPSDSHIATALRNQGYQVPAQLRMPTYWGSQPFTSGPVYLGAIVCFLALLSLFISTSRYKWWLVGATMFFLVLSTGKNMLFINDLMFHYLPMYNKFRTPSMALVIPQITFAILACLALRQVVSGDYEEKNLKNSIIVSGAIVGCFCLMVFAPQFALGVLVLFAIGLAVFLIKAILKEQNQKMKNNNICILVTICVVFAGIAFGIASSYDEFLSFSAASDEGYTQQYGAWFTQSLMMDRGDLAAKDAIRSLFFIALTVVILWIITSKERKSLVQYGICAIAVLSLFDLWNVSRRYCGDDNYMEKSEVKPYVPTFADTEILKDKDASYRVLTFNNPFNDAHISYFHKAIGGYNAVKLRDYQDLIDQQIEPEMMYIQGALKNVRSQADLDSLFVGTPVLNMLNMRYLIYNEGVAPLKNGNAMGNAWFVKKYKLLNDTTLSDKKYSASDLQMRMLSSVNLSETALVESQFASELAGKKLGYDDKATIELVSYKPNEMVYKTKSSVDALAVFSEIYYPQAWNASIDGQPTSHFRSDWLLRTMVVPAGEHTVVFRCDANTYWTLRNLGSTVSLLLLLALIGVVAYSAYSELRKDSGTNTTL